MVRYYAFNGNDLEISYWGMVFLKLQYKCFKLPAFLKKILRKVVDSFIISGGEPVLRKVIEADGDIDDAGKKTISELLKISEEKES